MTAIRLGIFALVAFSVLAHGAVEAWSAAVLEIGAAALFLVWGLLIFLGRQRELRWNALCWPLVALAGIGLFQYTTGLTVYRYLTRIELVKLGALLLLFFLAMQAFRTLRDWQRFVWFLLALGFVVSAFGIVQHFTFNGKLYWVRELRYGGIPFGPYVNRNHFAGLAELLVPLGVGLLVWRGVQRDQLPLVALFTIVPTGAVFLSASRAGIASFCFQAGLFAILIWKSSLDRKHLATGAAVLVLAVGMVAWLGVGRALERFGKFQELEVSETRRLAMIKDSWRIFLDHPLAGTGLGTLVVVYPRYETLYDGKVVHHAHNDFVELLAETGILGGVCGLAFLILLFRSGLANLRRSENRGALALHAGALVACAGLLVHGLVDFNLHIPSNALLFFLLAVLASSHIPAAVGSRQVARHALPVEIRV